jgi:hypothetical protein
MSNSRYADRIPTDATVTRLDLSADEERLTARYRKDNADDVEATITINGDFGLVETPGGVFIFDQDGCGAGPLPEDETYEFYGYASRPGSFSIMPCTVTSLTMSEVKARATGKSENLETFIRTFGARLESNYEVMRRAIEEAGA